MVSWSSYNVKWKFHKLCVTNFHSLTLRVKILPILSSYASATLEMKTFEALVVILANKFMLRVRNKNSIQPSSRNNIILFAMQTISSSGANQRVKKLELSSFKQVSYYKLSCNKFLLCARNKNSIIPSYHRQRHHVRNANNK